MIKNSLQLDPRILSKLCSSLIEGFLVEAKNRQSIEALEKAELECDVFLNPKP